MRGAVSKNINTLVDDAKIIKDDSNIGKKYVRRLKKNFWNSLNWIEKSKRMKVVTTKRFLDSILN